MRTNWNWKQAFAACALDNAESSGFLFERFVAASMLELGVSNLRVNATLVGGDGQLLQEIDVLANHRGRLLILDCKLRTKGEEGKTVEKLTSQIRQAYTTQRQLGGLRAQSLLIRPGRLFSDEERDLATAYGLKVLDANDSLDFFRKLAEFCGHTGPLPATFQDAQAELDGARRCGTVEALGCTQWAKAFRSGEPLSAVLPLGASLEQIMQDLGQDWIVYRIDESIWIRGRSPAGLSAKTIRHRLSDALKGTAMPDPQGFVLTKAGTTFHARLVLRPPQTIERLKQHLIGFKGGSIFARP